MSLPAPVKIVLATLEPVTVSAVAKALASRFSKFVTATVSPDVWSVPATTAKFTAAMVDPALTTSVSEPRPPSTEASVPWIVTISAPAPALMTSAPPLPSIVSAPLPPVRMFAADEPRIVTPVETALALTLVKLATAVESPND